MKDSPSSVSRGAETPTVTWVARAPIEAASTLLPKLLIQTFGEIAEAARRVAEAGVLGFECGDPLLEAGVIQGGIELMTARPTDASHSRRFVGIHKEKRDHDSSWSVTS
jgi:hypothetical protein